MGGTGSLRNGDEPLVIVPFGGKPFKKSGRMFSDLRCVAGDGVLVSMTGDRTGTDLDPGDFMASFPSAVLSAFAISALEGDSDCQGE